MNKAAWIIAAGVAVVLATAGGVGYTMYAQNAADQAEEKKWAPLIAAQETAHGIPAGLLHRQLYEESHYRTDIIYGPTVSSVGAEGIAQFMPATARDYGITNPFDPSQEIPAAARMMADLHREFGSWSLALAAYNWGSGNVAKWINTGVGVNDGPMPAQTVAYVQDITSAVPAAADYQV